MSVPIVDALNRIESLRESLRGHNWTASEGERLITALRDIDGVILTGMRRHAPTEPIIAARPQRRRRLLARKKRT